MWKRLWADVKSALKKREVVLPLWLCVAFPLWGAHGRATWGWSLYTDFAWGVLLMVVVPAGVVLLRREKLADAYTKARAKFDALSVQLKDIVDEINAIDALANIGEGSVVLLTIGKGETLTKVQGTVLAVRETEDGAKEYMVAYGQGFDADVKIVGASKLSLPVAESVEAPAA